MTTQPARLLRKLLLFVVLVVSTGCGGCDVLDPANYIDLDMYLPDLPPAEDAGDPADLDGGTADADSGSTDKPDTDFVFDFGSEDVAPDAPDAPFALHAVIPDVGPVPGGNQLRIRGEGLLPGTTVFVDGRQMQVDLAGDELVGRAPPGSGPGVVSIKAISPDGEIRALIDAYRYVEGLRVDSVSPTLVPTTGGVELELRGAGFEPTMGVSFSGTDALRVAYASPALVRVIAPPRPRGLADLRVTNTTDSLELEDAVEYYTPIVIDSVVPASGSVLGGDTVVLQGEGFTSDARVRFGNAEAAVVSVDGAAGTIEVTTPPNAAGPVSVFVWNRVDSAALSNAYLYRSDDAAALAGIHPAVGPESGGNEARIVGWGLDDPAASFLFGAVGATVVERKPSFARVAVPPGTGIVGVTLTIAGADVATLPAAYRYVPDLTVSSVAPDRGPESGGTVVTITGSGFADVEEVLVGGVPADYTVVSDTEITVTTPSHPAGTVDVTVGRVGAEASSPAAFTYEAVLEVWGFTPIRGAIAGGTYVEVRGRGFQGVVGAKLDGVDGLQARRIDSNNLFFYTPPHAPGEAVLEVSADSQTAQAPYTYLYFDPASRFGGASGSGVVGSVNVTVFAAGGGPIPDAFVMLSSRADTPYQGWTDANGQLTLSGPDVLGAQSTTATAAGYSSATLQTVDAENITLFLTRLDPSSGGGSLEPPPFGIIRGNIRATGKLADPDDSNSYDMAVVSTTQKTLYGGNPPAGPGAITLSDGEYEIVTRIGDMAVVGLCGTYHEPTDTFTPQFMAVERFVFISDQDELEIDLLCDIPLDQTHVYKLVNAPFAPTGPNNNRVAVFWDFGFEGVFPSPTTGIGFDPLVEVTGQPPLEGAIADISFTAVGGAYTGRGAPLSQSSATNIVDVDRSIILPTLLDVAEPVSPLPGGAVEDGLIRFEAAGPYYPDFYYVLLRNSMGIPVWTFILPGTETTVVLPDFPDFSSVAPDTRPAPKPSGPLFMTILAARIDGGHVYEQVSYRDIDSDLWEAYSLTSWAVRFP